MSIRIPAKFILSGVLSWVIFTIALSYILSVSTGYSPLCNPFLSGCTSISATGTHYPAAYFYTYGLVAGSAFLSLVWMVIVSWLIKSQKSVASKTLQTYLFFAVIGCFSLAFGEAFLPVEKHTKQIVHVLFTSIFFITNVMTIFYVTNLLCRSDSDDHNKLTFEKAKKYPFQVICACLLILMIIFYLIPNSILNDNAIEWNTVLIVILWMASFYNNVDELYLTVCYDTKQ